MKSRSFFDDYVQRQTYAIKRIIIVWYYSKNQIWKLKKAKNIFIDKILSQKNINFRRKEYHYSLIFRLLFLYKKCVTKIMKYAFKMWLYIKINLKIRENYTIYSLQKISDEGNIIFRRNIHHFPHKYFLFIRMI